jgi:hypothetical protein
VQAYFGVSGNFRSLLRVTEQAKRIGYKWLCRRSQRKRLTWERGSRTCFATSRSECPSKIVSHNFAKKPVFEGTLNGIKGQHLILDTGVANVRKYGGYHLELS